MLLTGGALFAAACLLGILIEVTPGGGVGGLDIAWNQLMAQVRQPWMLEIAYALNQIGGGWVAIALVPMIIIIALVLLRRWRGAVFAAAAFIAATGLTQILKHIFGRARPVDMLVMSDVGSFPSGHTANAMAIAVVLWLIFARAWVAVIGALWVVAMALSRTILSVHWASDTIGGALVGASAALVVGALLLRWASLGRGSVGWEGRPTIVAEE